MEVASNGTLAYALRTTDAFCPHGIAQDASGKIAVIGGEDPWLATPSGLCLLWLDASGQLLSADWLTNTADSGGYGLVSLLSGGVVAAGAAPNAGVQLQDTAVTAQPMSIKTYSADVPRVDSADGWMDDEMSLTEQSYVEDTGGGGRDGLLMKLNPLP
jgi:hypothetical protein